MSEGGVNARLPVCRLLNRLSEEPTFSCAPPEGDLTPKGGEKDGGGVSGGGGLSKISLPSTGPAGTHLSATKGMGKWKISSRRLLCVLSSNSGMIDFVADHSGPVMFMQSQSLGNHLNNSKTPPEPEEELVRAVAEELCSRPLPCALSCASMPSSSRSPYSCPLL